MGLLPICVDLSGRLCVVVGGGAVAARKATLAAEAGARVRVIAPEIDPAIERLAQSTPGGILIERRCYRRGDLADAAIAFAATGDAAVQEEIARDAGAANVWLNAVDEPERCSFIMPAIAHRGRITIAVTTGGASPLLARVIRDELVRQVGPEHVEAGEILAELRRRYAPGERRREVLARLLDEGLLDALRSSDRMRVERLLHDADQSLAPEGSPGATGLADPERGPLSGAA